MPGVSITTLDFITTLMDTENLGEFLKELTLSAIATQADGAERIDDLIDAIAEAVATRRIVDCVQFEEMWDEVVDEAIEQTNVSFFFITFRLSPEVCEAAYDEGKQLNELTWTLMLPDVESLEMDVKPDSSIELLSVAEIDVNTQETWQYEYLKSLIALEQPTIN
jgi:hypothetical protein